jgi:hypothetical protein
MSAPYERPPVDDDALRAAFLGYTTDDLADTITNRQTTTEGARLLESLDTLRAEMADYLVRHPA